MGLYEQLLREHGLLKSTTSQEVTPEDTLTYASGQDAARHYSKNQERWKAFSIDVMNELVRNMSQDTGKFSISERPRWEGPQGSSDFEHMFRFCARKRGEIARELDHDKAACFGDFRGEYFESWENLYGDPNRKQAWKNVQHKVFDSVISLVLAIPDNNYEAGYTGQSTYDGDSMCVTRKEITATQKEKDAAHETKRKS